MIVIEGPDGAGKTTLVQTLADRMNLEIAPRVVSKEANAIVDLKRWVESNIAIGWQRRLFDRFSLISDPIYRHILPGKKSDHVMYTELWQSVQLDRFVKDVRPLIIFCLPPWPIVKTNIENDPDNVAIKDSLERIYCDYAATIALYRLIMGTDLYIHNYLVDGDAHRVTGWLQGKLA